MGFRHEGQPKGSLQEIFDLETYIAKPQVSQCCKSTKVTYEDKYIVILTDIYGHKFNNVQLIVDELADKTGLSVLVPDILFGDPVIKLDGSTHLQEWLSKHSPEKTINEAVQPFLQKLRDEKNHPSLVSLATVLVPNLLSNNWLKMVLPMLVLLLILLLSQLRKLLLSPKKNHC